MLPFNDDFTGEDILDMCTSKEDENEMVDPQNEWSLSNMEKYDFAES